MRDAIAAHREGVPTVVLVHGPFEQLARAQSAALGLPDLPVLVYAQDSLGRDSDEQITSKAKEVAVRIRAFLV